MTSLQLLLVEDELRYVEQYQDVLEAYVEEHKRPIRMRVCRTLAAAKDSLDASIDAAVVDLNLGGDTTDGGEIIKELKDHFRVPVAVLTGTPDDAEEEPPVIRVFTKGQHDFNEVLDCLWEPYSIGLTRIMGGRGLLEEQLNKVFLRNLLPTLDVWIDYGQQDAERTEKALLRYALGHLVAGLDGDETPCYPEEFYLAPPLDEALTTGSFVEEEGNGTRYVVLTPACDLVPRDDGKPKTETIILVEVVEEEVVHSNIKKFNSGIKGKLQKNNYKNCYHWLPMSKHVIGGYLDFRQLQTLRLDDLECGFKKLGPRIAPRFHQRHRVPLLRVLCAAGAARHRRASHGRVRRTCHAPSVRSSGVQHPSLPSRSRFPGRRRRWLTTWTD